MAGGDDLVERRVRLIDRDDEGADQAGEPVDLIIDVEPDELIMDIPFDDHLVVMDVRKETEFADGHIKDAVNIPLNTLTDPASMANIEETDNVYVHCAGGYRSMIAASILKARGWNNIIDIDGGMKAIGATDVAKTSGAAAVNS